MLRGLRVIELATYIAAPGAAGIMADWGADVIKIESPDGDPMRGFFDTLGSDQAANPIFELDNRGKRSVVLDIRTPAGRDAGQGPGQGRRRLPDQCPPRRPGAGGARLREP